MSPASFSREFESFLSLSAVLTGFERVELLGTGVGQRYFEEFAKILGADTCDELWRVAREIFSGPAAADAEAEVRKRILSDPKLGPVARNITITWYLARWYKMPQEWHRKYGYGDGDVNHVISADSYPEGLVWRAIDTHPPGAKPTGFGIWSLPPKKEGAA